MPQAVLAMLMLVVVALAGAPASGHEIPGRADVELRIADDAEVVRVVARVPLGALQDLELPLRGDGTLVLEAADGALRDAALLWITDALQVRAGDATPAAELRAVRASRPSAAPFADFERALEHVTSPPLAPSTRLRPEQAHLDVLVDFPLAQAERDAARSLEPRLAFLGLVTRIDLGIRARDGTERRLTVDGAPGVLPLDPGIGWVASSFVRSGVEHILVGVDHLLFLVCLVLPLLAWRPLLVMVTAFTAGHTVTLIAASLGWAPSGAWFPALMETLIAASIAWMALANVYRAMGEGADQGADQGAYPGRWRTAFLFGLVHGFGFAFVLADVLQFSGDHLVLALLAFNVGVEIGQLLFLLVAVPLLGLLLARLPRRLTLVALAALVLHTAWHWMLERGEVFLAYPLAPPALDLLLLRGLLQAALLAVVAFVLYGLLGRLARALGEDDGRTSSAVER